MEARPAELKHLSRQRKRHQNEIPIVAASEVGRAQTRVSDSGVVGPAITDQIFLVEPFWKEGRYRVIVPYAKGLLGGVTKSKSGHVLS